MALIGYQEKVELEALILEQLGKHFDSHGPQALLEHGVSVAVSVRGVSVVPAGLDLSDTLAHVEVRSLFTAVCYREAGGTDPLPRDALAELAKEAANATAQQINRITSSKAGS